MRYFRLIPKRGNIVDTAEIGKNVAVDLPIVGDAKIVLNQLIKELEAKPSDKNAWLKSIVEFNAAIYNRWGQQLYSWGIDQIACEECGWDGTYKGKPVKDGVYFVVVTARGADGVSYEIRRDVNLLRGYTENASK